jgi:hypothetical protein
MPVHQYTNWNKRSTDGEKQIEPYRKYFFICEGAKTETFYFRNLIDKRKELKIPQMIELCLLEKTGEDQDISFPKKLAEFAEEQKKQLNEFDPKRDKMVIVFDADIFEEKVKGYDEFIKKIEEDNIIGVTNPGFELFLLLHIEGAYEKYIENKNDDFFVRDNKNSFSHAYKSLLNETNMNAKRNPNIGLLADNVIFAIEQEKKINHDIHMAKGRVTSNIGKIIENIMNDNQD